jgi:hypothetical protein
MMHDACDGFDMRYRIVYEQSPNSKINASDFAKNETCPTLLKHF